jgi:hypothetical protein
VMAAAPGGHGGSGSPLLTGTLLLYFAGYVLWAGVRLMPVAVSRSGRVTGGGTGWGDRPEVARACRLSMGIGMFAMLLTV